MSSTVKSSPSSQEEAPAAVPASRPQAPNQSSPAPPAPLPVISAPARPPAPAPAGRVHRNMRRTTPWRNNSPYGGRQAGNSQMMQQPVRYGNHYQNNMVPVQVIMNNGSGVLISYDYMGWNYCWSVTGSWTLTISPSNYPPLTRLILPSPQHPNRPAPVNDNRAAPIPPLPAPENSPAAPPPPPPALPADPDQPNQPDDLDLDSSLHL